MEYIAYLDKDKDSDYGVSFPDLPGCITVGSTLEEARRYAVDALATAIAGMVEDGDPVPAPSSLDDLADDPDMAGAVAVMIAAETPDPTVRFNITARESQLAAIDRVAKASGMNRSAYLVFAALRGPYTGLVDEQEDSPVARIMERKRTVRK